MTNPYADTATTYWNAGWRGVLPLPARAKKNPPAGYTGSTGTDPAYPDIATWMQDGERNICLRMPANIIGIDVDAYGDKAGAFTLREKEAEWGQLPPTWRSTSRDDGISGIRLYRVPVGLAWPGEVGPGIETVRRDHRYVVVAPSVHPDTGDRYRWIDPKGIVVATGVPDPDTLPLLPERWVQGLTGGELAKEVQRNDLKADAAMLWIANHHGASAPACKRMQTAIDASVADLRDHSAHDTALAGVARLLRLGDEGHTGVVSSVVRLRDAFVAEVTRAERAILGKRRLTENEALREWTDMLVSGVNFVSAQPSPVPTCDCDGLLTDAIVGSASATTVTDTPAADDEAGPTEDTGPRFPQLVDGATFVLNAPEQPPAIWGWGDDIIWAEGESLMIVGPPGVGKTTLCGQVVRARLTGDGAVLGLGVAPTKSKVLYLAMDRPRQIARSLRRHFSEDDRDLLASKLVVWEGPPPADVAKNTSVILSLAKLAGADTVVVDSVKDAAIGLSNDEVGAAYNQARQHVLAAGIQMLELHHLVKRGPNGAKPTQLADVYGSTWITSGAGSVLLIWGQAGDLVVELTHLKQPVNDIGPLHIEHDHTAGISSVFHGDSGEHATAESLLSNAGSAGITKRALAVGIFGTDDPTDNQIRKAARKLEELERRGIAGRIKGGGRGNETRWYAVDKPTDKPTEAYSDRFDGNLPKPTADADSPTDKPTNKPTETDHAETYQPTLSVRQGVGLVPAADRHVYRDCEDCGNPVYYKHASRCVGCIEKRAKGGGL